MSGGLAGPVDAVDRRLARRGARAVPRADRRDDRTPRPGPLRAHRDRRRPGGARPGRAQRRAAQDAAVVAGVTSIRVMHEVRRIIRVVVEDLRRRLESEIRASFTGRPSLHRHSPLAVAANFDPRGTIRANLRHWDVEGHRLVLEQPAVLRAQHAPDPVGDRAGRRPVRLMAGSVIHSAVMAGILPGCRRTGCGWWCSTPAVVDLSDQVGGPGRAADVGAARWWH